MEYNKLRACLRVQRSISPFSMQALAAGALALVIALFSGCHQDPNIVKQKYLESGRRHSAENQYQEAVIQYLNAIKIDKNFAQAHYELAQAYLNLGEYFEAYTELEKAVDLQPANYAARIDLGKLLLAGGKLDEAQLQAGAVLKAQPNNPDVHALLSALAIKQNRRETALQEARRAIELNPERSDFHDNLALLLASDPTQLATAEAELKTAASLEPHSANSRILLTDFYMRLSRWGDAEQAGKSAIATAPNDMSARKTLTKVYFLEGKRPEAEAVLKQASQDFASNPEGARMLADYYTATGQFGNAKTEYARLASRFPSNLPIQENYIRVLLNTHDVAAAHAVIDELLKKHPKEPRVVALNAVLLIQDGKPQDAVAQLQKAVRDTPDDAFLRFWLGKADLANGNSDEAEKSFLEASRLDPNNVDAQETLAEIGAQRGDSSLVSSEADKMISTAPHYAVGYIWRAMCEMRDGADDKADADLKTAIAVAPNNSAAYLQMGKLRFAEKRYLDGIASLEQALRYNPDAVDAIQMIMSYYAFQKQPEKALARLKAQMALRPKTSGFYDLLAEWDMNSKQIDQASAAANTAIQLNPEDAQAVILYAQSEVQLGKTATAISVWQRWINEHPRDAMAVALVGTLEESSGNINEAEDLYKKSLQIQDHQPLAANNLAYLMLERGENVDVALTLAQIARQNLPDSPETADTLAWAYYHKGVYDFARDLLDGALKNEPDNASFHYHLGMVEMKLNQLRQANLQLHRVEVLAPNTPVAKQAENALHAMDGLTGL